jgi:uncharacterized protein (DUF885 family)
MPEPFVPLAERIVDAMLDTSPTTALYAGDHRADDRLEDFSAEGVARRVAMLQDASDALAAVDPDALDVDERIDHAILTSRVERDMFELTEVREHEWNPLVHNPGELLYTLIDRAHAPAAERLEKLAARLAAVPDALADARATLRDCPRVHLETAIGQFAGSAALIRDQLPPLYAEAPGREREVAPRAASAAAALDEFEAWLRTRVDGATRDPRLGRRRWEARLWHTLDTEMSASAVFAAAEKRLAEVTDALRETAAGLVGGLPNDETVRRAFAAAAERRPDNTTIVGRAVEALADTTAFVREHELVSLVDDVCQVLEMPEHERGVSIAYLDPPGPLETAEVPAHYCIAPAPADWSPERVASFYREYNDDMVRDLTVHEAMPGHFLQLAHARRYRGSTRVRALGFSGPFVEGWAVYAEEFMVDHGYGGAPLRLQQLKMALRMTINALLDQLTHCEDLTESEAMALMCDRGFQEEGEAAGKWRRAQLTSTQLSTYFVGYTEVAAIGAARPAGTSVRDWHDAMLAHGSPPPRHLADRLGINRV